MDLHNLKPAKGSTHTNRRLGRGYGSGKGRTATRGHKGAKARSGYKRKIGFEGGQMPLQRRVPKFGFRNVNRVEYKAVNLDAIQKLADEKQLDKVGVAEMVEAGLLKKKALAKVLAQGELTRKIDVEAHAFSAKAQEQIEKQGGVATKLA